MNLPLHALAASTSFPSSTFKSSLFFEKPGDGEPSAILHFPLHHALLPFVLYTYHFSYCQSLAILRHCVTASSLAPSGYVAIPRHPLLTLGKILTFLLPFTPNTTHSLAVIPRLVKGLLTTLPHPPSPIPSLRPSFLVESHEYLPLVSR